MKSSGIILMFLSFCFFMQAEGLSQLVYSGIEREYITPIYSEQQNPEWCWAANVQLVLNYYGARVSQEDIIKRSFGVHNPYDNLPKWDKEFKNITSRLNGWVIHYNKDRYFFHIKLVYGSPSPELLLKELKNSSPVIFADSINADSVRPIVITAVGFLPGYYGPVIKELMVRDVMPNNPDNSKNQINKWKISDVSKNISAYWLINVSKEKIAIRKNLKKKKVE